MQIDIGSVHEGTVTGLTKFGAFVKLENGASGMVHISEVSNEYVSEISDHLAEGDKVKVKVIEINEKGKISLSIKKALPQQEKPKPSKPKRENNNNRGWKGKELGRDLHDKGGKIIPANDKKELAKRYLP